MYSTISGTYFTWDETKNLNQRVDHSSLVGVFYEALAYNSLTSL